MICHGLHGTPIENAESIARDGLRSPGVHRGICLTPPSWEGAAPSYAVWRRQRQRAMAGLEDEEDVRVALIHVDASGLDAYALPAGALDSHDLLCLTSVEAIEPERLHIVERTVRIGAPSFKQRMLTAVRNLPDHRPLETAVKARAYGLHVAFTPSAIVPIPTPGAPAPTIDLNAPRWQPVRIPWSRTRHRGLHRAYRRPAAPCRAAGKR